MLFNWLRQLARNAVLAGTQDAVEELAPAGEQTVSLERLRAIAAEAKALPPAREEDEPKRKGRDK